MSLTQSESSTALFYTLMAELKDMADAAQPTLFHHLLKRLDREGRLQRVYTQNIDGLEEKAGLTFGFGEELSGPSKRKREPITRDQRGFARSQSDSVLMRGREKPMFPRAIPLHGSLSTMSCALCSYTLALRPDIDARAKAALDSMREGQPVWCDECHASDHVRTSAGLRSRGIGRMIVDVVLYNGENTSAEHVGACVERDILGLRDPCEPDVPETPREQRARERKERGLMSCNTSDVKAETTGLECIKEDVGDLSMNSAELNADSVLAEAFGADDESVSSCKSEKTAPRVVPPAVPEPLQRDVTNVLHSPEKPAPAPRPRRLKPLPPDLLIVAGTSLKVPGTKRIVREFAKACRAKDGDHDSDNAPIRAVYLNYDFPTSTREWNGVFDMWIRGDVQQAALGLCTPQPDRLDADPAAEAYIAQHSWQALAPAAAAPRKAEKQSRLGLTGTKPSAAHRKTASGKVTVRATRSAASEP